MPFIPHTQDEVTSMLESIGAKHLDELFKDIPKEIYKPKFHRELPSYDELNLSKLLRLRADENFTGDLFLGAGSYKHYIPPAVWALASRGEFMTAYTPYQAEASQGSLQLFWEFQTMIASLMQMDVANASLYDGATSVFEAIMMIFRTHKVDPSQSVVYVASTLHPHYREVLKTLLGPHHTQLIEVQYDPNTGTISLDNLVNVFDASKVQNNFSGCFILPQPNFFGQLEAADTLTDWANDNHLKVVGVVNPVAMALLKPPGEWGGQGAEVACGEGQSLGVPLSSGGPYFGFFSCKETYLRQMPGRLVGKTVDKQGRACYTLTLQAREQHIRRARATSNICTNQGLFVIAATIYLSLLGPEGLKEVATISHQRMVQLTQALAKTGIKTRFQGAFFHENVFEFSQNVSESIDKASHENIVLGLVLQKYYPELKNCLLSCTTELIDDEAIDKFVKTGAVGAIA